MFINHKRCPECGARLKHYYWYCGDCDNQNLTNWPLMIVIVIAFVIMMGFIALNFLEKACYDSFLQQLVMNWGINC